MWAAREAAVRSERRAIDGEWMHKKSMTLREK